MTNQPKQYCSTCGRPHFEEEGQWPSETICPGCARMEVWYLYLPKPPSFLWQVVVPDLVLVIVVIGLVIWLGIVL